MVQLYFGSFNTGRDGVTAMFVDDVSLELCTGYTTAMTEQGVMPVASEEALEETAEEDVLSISGRVTNNVGLPQAGEIVRLSNGDMTTTDDDGYYSFVDLNPELYVVIPPLPGALIFQPPSWSVAVPPAEGVDFYGLPNPEPNP